MEIYGYLFLICLSQSDSWPVLHFLVHSAGFSFLYIVLPSFTCYVLGCHACQLSFWFLLSEHQSSRTVLVSFCLLSFKSSNFLSIVCSITSLFPHDLFITSFFLHVDFHFCQLALWVSHWKYSHVKWFLLGAKSVVCHFHIQFSSLPLGYECVRLTQSFQVL